MSSVFVEQGDSTFPSLRGIFVGLPEPATSPWCGSHRMAGKRIATSAIIGHSQSDKPGNHAGSAVQSEDRAESQQGQSRGEPCQA